MDTTPEGSIPQNPGQSAAQKNTLMGVLAYLGILVIIPYLMAKEDPFVKFHIKQGLVLLVLGLIVTLIGLILPIMLIIAPVILVLRLGLLALVIIGIVNVLQGKEKELPLVGQFGSKFTF